MLKRFEGRFITVTDDGKFERAYLRASVQVIPFTNDGKILMIKEHRPVEGISRWKFVSGFIDKEGLSAEQIAQEELMEEAGFEAKRLVRYFHHEHQHSLIIPITYFLAYDLQEKRLPNPDGDVIEDVQAFTIEELHERVLKGEFDFLHEASIIMKLYRDYKSGSILNYPIPN